DLRLCLSIGDEEIERSRAGHGALAVLARDAEPDLGVDAQVGGGVELERLPPELTLTVFEAQRLPGPAALALADVPLTEVGVTHPSGEAVGDPLLIAAHQPEA